MDPQHEDLLLEDRSGYRDESIFDQRYSEQSGDMGDYQPYQPYPQPPANLSGTDSIMFIPEPKPTPIQAPAQSVDPNETPIIIAQRLIGPGMVIIFGRKTQFVQFHAHQGLILSTGLWLFSAVFLWNWIAFLCVALLVLFVLLLISFKAIQDMDSEECFKLPGLGNWAYSNAERRLVATHIPL